MATNPSAFPNALSAGSLLAEPSWFPADAGKLAWTFDPAVAAANSTAAAGTIFLCRVNVRSPVSCTNVELGVAVAGGTLTAGQCFAGLYTSAGVQVGVTADQSTPWGTAGFYSMPLTGGPFALPAGFYWVAFVSNGTTGPAFARGANLINATFGNIGLTAATARYASNGTGTALPASITPASNNPTSAQYWAGLS